MRVGLCQFESPEEVVAGVDVHLREATRAADRGCDLVLFPELSLTGYEPAIAERHAVSPASPLLDPLGRLAAERTVTIAVGVPLRASDGIEIGLVCFHPDGSRSDYAKQLLHEDERPFFVPGDRTLDLCVGGHRIAPGICYEALQSSHRRAAVERGSTLYAASVAKHEEGIAEAHRSLAAFAARHAMPVVLVNAVGPNDGWISAGRSAAWRADGSLVDELGGDAGLLVVDLEA